MTEDWRHLSADIGLIRYPQEAVNSSLVDVLEAITDRMNGPGWHPWRSAKPARAPRQPYRHRGITVQQLVQGTILAWVEDKRPHGWIFVPVIRLREVVFHPGPCTCCRYPWAEHSVSLVSGGLETEVGWLCDVCAHTI